jgi:hypothetical protein
MNRRLIQNLLSVLMVVVYAIGTAVPLTLDNHDEMMFPSSDHQTITTHGCAGKELHKNIDFNHYCPACYRQLTSVAKLDGDIVLLRLSSEKFFYQHHSVPRPFRIIVLPILRGPPPAVTLS